MERLKKALDPLNNKNKFTYLFAKKYSLRSQINFVSKEKIKRFFFYTYYPIEGGLKIDTYLQISLVISYVIYFKSNIEIYFLKDAYFYEKYFISFSE